MKNIVEHKSGLSVCMIVRNEEKVLGRCLESVRSVADQIIIVDTGSTDSTIEIAGKYGATVVCEPWQDDFSHARNISLLRAEYSWILWLDADDVVPGSSLPFISKLKAEQPRQVLTFIVRNEKPGNIGSEFLQARMFPNGMGIVFERRIHEQMMPSALKAGLKLESVPVVIEHHGYGDPEMMKRKAERNANLLIADYNKNSPEPVTAVEIADSYTIMERYSDAQYWYRHVLSIAGCVSDFPAIASQAWMGLGNISNREKDYKSAIESFQNSLKHCPGRPDALYGLAVSYHMDGAYQPAVEALEQIINSQSRTPVQVSIDFRQTLIKAYIRCAAILGTQKKFEELGKLVTKAIAVLGERPEILNMAGTAYFQQNKMMDALHSFEKSLNVATAGNIDAYIGLCMIYIKVGKPETASITLENIKPLFSMSPRYLAFLEMANLKSGRVYSQDENEKIAVEKEYLFRLYQQK